MSEYDATILRAALDGRLFRDAARSRWTLWPRQTGSVFCSEIRVIGDRRVRRLACRHGLLVRRDVLWIGDARRSELLRALA